MPQKIPGIGEDVSHLFAGGGTAIGDDVSHLFGAAPSGPRRPVSAEDFMTPQDIRNRESLSGWPAKIGEAAKALPGVAWQGLKGAAKLGYDATMEPMLHPLRPMNESPLAEDLRGIGAASADQVLKSVQAGSEGRWSEAVGHGASALPLVGPAMAQAGEKIAASDPEGLAEAAVLAGAPVAGKAIPAAGRAAARAATATGRAVAPIARAAAPLAVPLALDAASHYFGGPIGFTLFKALKSSLEASKRTPEASVNVGGRVVPAAARSAEADMAAMLDDVAQPTPPPPPARITTPPPLDLPPGYTPRTTVPKPKPAKAELPAAHPARKAAEAKAAKPEAFTPEEVARAKARIAARDAASPPARAEAPRPYFLRSPEETARFERFAAETPEAVAPTDFTDIRNYPASMRGMTDQPIVRVTKAEVEQIANQLVESGHAPADIMRDVAKRKDLHPQTRLELMTALGKIAKRKK